MMKRFGGAVAALLTLLVGVDASAEWTLGDMEIAGPACDAAEGACVHVPIPCQGTSLALSADRAYVSCDTGGVLVVDVAASPPRALEVRRMLESVAATRVLLVEGTVWVETPLGMRPIEAFDRTPPATLAPPTEPTLPAPAAQPEAEAAADTEPERVAGHVVDLGTGWVIVDIGAAQGLREEGFVEFLRIEDVDLGAGQVVSRERRLGVGQVDTLSETRARVELGLNERIPLGAVARANPGGITAKKVLLTPPRPHGVWEVEVNARPFLALSTLGGGAILDGRIGRRFEIPLAIDALFTPFAFGVARDGDILTFAGNVVVSYDTTVFQIGLGAGASRINTLPVAGSDFIAGADAEPPSFRVGFSAAQFVRLGAVDGVHISVLNNFSLFEDEFVFGGITIQGQVPVRLFKELAWIEVRGGGGVPGHLFGEIGLRILARGNGGPGSVFLTPTVGAGTLTGERWDTCDDRRYVFDGPVIPAGTEGICRIEYDYGGPLIGFGAQWRF